MGTDGSGSYNNYSHDCMFLGLKYDLAIFFLVVRRTKKVRRHGKGIVIFQQMVLVVRFFFGPDCVFLTGFGDEAVTRIFGKWCCNMKKKQ
jgi:hypothetical protein